MGINYWITFRCLEALFHYKTDTVSHNQSLIQVDLDMLYLFFQGQLVHIVSLNNNGLCNQGQYTGEKKDTISTDSVLLSREEKYWLLFRLIPEFKVQGAILNS